MSLVVPLCNMNLPIRLFYYGLRPVMLIRPPKKNFNSIIRQCSGKNTSICEEVGHKNLLISNRLLNMLKRPRKPEEVVLKCPISPETDSNQDDKSTIIKCMNLLHSPPGVNLEQTKEVLDWWLELKAAEELQDQAYDIERVRLHGPDSAAAHFFIDRHASVKLVDSDEWIIGGRPALKCCVSGYFVQAERGEKDYRVEAIDCTNFHNNGVRYEGLKYLSGLNYLKELILCNQPLIDAFCLDRIAGQNGRTLERLDLTGCNLDAGCIVALDRMEALKSLIVTMPKRNSDLWFEMMLFKKYKPGLKIQMYENTRRPERLSTKSAPRPTVIYPRVCRGKTPPVSALKQPFQ